MLYRGTYISELDYIKANSKSHTTGQKVAYFTEERIYALVCCRTPEENFVTMGKREDGKYHYFERFPKQLETLYSNKRGYLYIINSKEGLINTKDKTWESSTNVTIDDCEIVDDVYFEILKEEKEGNVIIHRYEEIDPSEQKMHANYIKEHLDDDLVLKPFYLKHFSLLWD